jgi:hypothetical protein
LLQAGTFGPLAASSHQLVLREARTGEVFSVELSESVATSSKNGAAARTRSVGTKLTEEEFARLESLAAASGQSVSEWARSALLAATTPSTPSNPSNPNQDAAVLGEVRALRAIVLNLFFDLANGEEITVESVKEIIAKADAKKGS